MKNIPSELKSIRGEGDNQISSIIAVIEENTGQEADEGKLETQVCKTD